MSYHLYAVTQSYTYASIRQMLVYLMDHKTLGARVNFDHSNLRIITLTAARAHTLQYSCLRWDRGET